MKLINCLKLLLEEKLGDDPLDNNIWSVKVKVSLNLNHSDLLYLQEIRC